MEKEIFIYLYKFQFNNKKFAIFWSKKTGCFPLELIDKALIYADYEDYIGIYKELVLKKSLKKRLCNFLTNKKSGEERNNNSIKHKYFSFKPYVRKAGNGLISFTLALILSGCVVATPYDSMDSQTIEKVVEQAKSQNVIVEYNQDLDEFIVKEYIDSETQERVICVDDLDQLRKFFPNEKQHPTYEDVHEAINDLIIIPHNIKLILHELANNLEKNAPNLDLFLLYHNLERLKVYEGSNRYIENKTFGTLGEYDSETGILAFYYTNLPLSTYGHECGHMADSLNEHLEDEHIKILYCKFPILYLSHSNRMYLMDNPEEGLENLFALKASNQQAYEHQKTTNTYVTLTEGSKVILNSIGWSIENYISNSGISFLLAIRNRGIEDPVASLARLSNIYNDHEYAEYDQNAYNLEDWVSEYSYQIGKFDISNNQYDQTKIDVLFDNSAYDGDLIISYYRDEDDNTIAWDKYDKHKIRDAVKKSLDDLSKQGHFPFIEFELN